MKTKVCFVAIAAICIFLGFYLSSTDLLHSIDQMFNLSSEANVNCTKSSDCDWVITNCCKETAGGLWECVNLKTFKQTECQVNVICPQMFSPRPTAACTCKEGSCMPV